MTDLTDFIQQVKQSNDIVDVIGSYLELRPKGTTHWARCPFHGEKTASFSVNRNLQIYKCFGCGESGDVIKFVEKYESLTFMEALEKLAKRANLKMPETALSKQDKDFTSRKQKQEVYGSICRDAAVFYYKAYYSEKGAAAREYVKSRGFTSDTVKKFGIGYSPDQYSLVRYLQDKQYAMEDCLACGVLQRKSANGELFDALSYRLIIPIFNMQGKVIAFGGRGITDAEINFGKYKNTSETPLFSKKNNLFALNIAKEQKQQAALPNIVVVEGYMDVIAMYQAGFKRAVASMGTSLTESQAKWLSRLTDTVYICYDGDAAGQKATVRGLDILDKAGLEVKVMSVPERLDPDEYIKKYGSEAFESLIDDALPLPDYKLRLLDTAFPIDSVDTAKRNDNLPKYVKGALIMLKQYVAAVSLKTGYSQEYIRRKLVQESTEPSPDVSQRISPQLMAQYFVAACLLSGQDFASINFTPQCDTLFLNDLYAYLAECKSKEVNPAVDMIYTVCPYGTAEEYSAILDVDFSKAKYAVNKQNFKECRALLEKEILIRQKEELLKKVQQNPDDLSLLAELGEISKKINSVN